MARNPRIIYARGTGHGPRGPDADKGGYDGVSFWARSGVSIAAMPADAEYPVGLPGPAFGDIQSGAHLAGGIAAALFRRERTGRGAIAVADRSHGKNARAHNRDATSFLDGAPQLRRQRIPSLDFRRPPSASIPFLVLVPNLLQREINELLESRREAC